MHIYDYSFLDSFPLPENLVGLLDCLRGIQRRLAPKAGPDAPAQELSGLPTQLISAYEASDAEPLLLIPCVTLDVLGTLPEGSDSQSTAIDLAKQLLCRAGYTMCRSFPLEDKICTYRFFYQRALDRALVHWEQNGSAYLYYIEMFLSLLYLCGKDIHSTPSAIRRKTKRAAIETVVLQSAVPISKAEICAVLPEVSPTTVEAALGAMVREGRIQKVGAARAVRYIRA